MHKKLVQFVKYNKFFLTVYRYVGNFFTWILRHTVRTKRKRILFLSFGGQKYDDSPKVLYEYILQDDYFRDYELIWGFTNPEAYDISCKKVKVDTLQFYIVAVSAHIWIDNSSMERGLHLKKKNCIEINTRHGFNFKMGDKLNLNLGNGGIGHKEGVPTIYCAQCEFDREICAHANHTTKDHVLLSDLPRNDPLFAVTEQQVKVARERLQIPQNKKVILYAPTYREFSRDKFNVCYLKPPIDLKKWRVALGDEYVLLFRAHYEVVNVLGIGEDDDFIRNVSAYPVLTDLMIASDLLISDYSSIYMDYSILEKPMFSFVYDYDEYMEKRGLYLDLYEVMPCRINRDEDSLIAELLEFDYEDYCEKTRAFKRRFAPNAGFAAHRVVCALKDQIAKYAAV